MQGNLPLTGGPFTHNALRCGPHPAFGSLELNPPFTGRPQFDLYSHVPKRTRVWLNKSPVNAPLEVSLSESSVNHLESLKL